MRNRGMLVLLAGLLLAGGLVLAVLRDRDDPPRYAGTLRVLLKSGYLPFEAPYTPGEKPYPIHERMAAFLDLYPEVRIEVRDAEGAIRDLRGAAGDAEWVPDIVELAPAEARQMADSRRIVSLARRISRGAVWEDGYHRLIGYAAIDGKPYLLPVTADPLVVYYDSTTFRQGGVPYPSEDWDWEEFTRKANWLAGLGAPPGIPTDLESLEPFIRGLGGAYLSGSGGTASGRLDDDATVEAFSRFAGEMPIGEAIRDRPGKGRMPAIGLIRASEMHRLIRERAGYYQPAPMPAAPSGERFNTSRMTGLAITADSRNKALAWELMTFIAGDSDDEALRFVAANTLETASMWYRVRQDSRYETLKDVIAREIVHAPPASFDWTFADPDALPVLTLEELQAMADPREAKAILGRTARKIDEILASRGRLRIEEVRIGRSRDADRSGRRLEYNGLILYEYRKV